MNLENLSRSKIKHIIVTELTYEKLKEKGKLGDTFNDVIMRLLEKKEG